MLLAPTLSLSAGSGAAIARPTFSRDFAGEKTLNNGTGPAITFTRASGATYFDANGVLQTAANDAPRFDHDPVTGESRGLLIEEQRTNLLVRSAELDNAAWTKDNSTVTANAATAPDGTTTADKLVENASNTDHYAVNAVTLGSVTMTCSAFLKAGERTRALVFLSDYVGAVAFASVDLTAGTVSAFHQSPWTDSSATIQAVGNGWFRVSITATAGQGTAKGAAVFVLNNTGEVAYTGDGTSGLFIWGAQLEAGAFATSYIPTTSAAATRAADSAVVTPISSFYNQVEGTLFAENTFSAMGSDSFAAAFDNNTGIGGGSGDEMKLWKWKNDNNLYASITDSDNLVAQAGTTTPVTTSTVCKYGLAMAVNNFAASFFGSAAATDTNCAMPTVSHFRIGQAAFAGAGFLNGHIRKIAYWPKRLSNTLLQQLTT
jgi:hypothetical protein